MTQLSRHPIQSTCCALLVACSALPALANASARGDERGREGSPPFAVDRAVGVWLPVITPRNCDSDTPGPSFIGMSVLHHGGTLSETNASAPTTRGPAFGTWSRTADGYQSQFRFMRFAPDGTLAGFTVVRRAFTLSPDGQTALGRSTFEILLPNGNVVLSGCTTDVAVRFQ